MDQFTRRIIGFGVHRGDVDGIALCRMFNKAISRMGTPKYLSTDHDPLFEFHRWKANLRILDVDDLHSAPKIEADRYFIAADRGMLLHHVVAEKDCNITKQKNLDTTSITYHNQLSGPVS